MTRFSWSISVYARQVDKHAPRIPVIPGNTSNHLLEISLSFFCDSTSNKPEPIPWDLVQNPAGMSQTKLSLARNN